jgi:hypothetical protein
MLGAAALRSPSGEAIQLVAIFPVQVKELMGVEVGAFFAEKSLKSPLEVGAVPRMQAITARYRPVVAKCIPHISVTKRSSSEATFLLVLAALTSVGTNRGVRKYVREPAPSPCHVSPISPYSAGSHRSSCHPWSSRPSASAQSSRLYFHVAWFSIPCRQSG